MDSGPECEIAGDEWLYRRICPADVDYTNGKLRPQCIRVPSLSVNRSGNSKIEDVMDGAYNGAAEVQRRNVPKEVVCKTSEPRARFMVNVCWVPEENNPAHSEIRFRREGKEYSKNKIKSDAQRGDLQKEIVKWFDIRIFPTKTEEF